jgi:hypothetical protein
MPPRPHGLRAGIHPKVVSERLGHANVSITLDTYSQAIPALREEAAALIAGLVFAGEAAPAAAASGAVGGSPRGPPYRPAQHTLNRLTYEMLRM